MLIQIANPIYDVVFKYLMEDQEVAKLIISTIIGEEIETLTFLPQENTVFLQKHFLTVYRLDFSAKIKTAEGESKQVLIEIQKAKFATDIMRFRRYLGEQYQDNTNIYWVKHKNGKRTRYGLPIVSIYFLGYQLEQITAPVIKVARQYYDLTTGQEITERELFIESLTHDSYVIQIPRLHSHHQSEIEKLLMIFDQRHVTMNDHVVTINEEEIPERYDKVIRRLQRVVASPEMKRSMDVEDDILEELQNMERLMEREVEQRDKLLAEQLQALTEQQQTLMEQQQALTEKQQALTEKEQALEAKDKALAEQQKLIADLQKQLESQSS